MRSSGADPRLRRLRAPEPLAAGGFDFTPFKEDFEFIVCKLKAERLGLVNWQLAAAVPAVAATRVPQDAIIELGPADALLLDEPARAGGGNVYGQRYSILEHAMINELYERRKSLTSTTLRDALTLLMPTSKRGWVALVGLLSMLLVLWTVLALRNSSLAGNSEWSVRESDRQLWWAFVTRRHFQKPATAQRCRTTVVGAAQRVVDSHGVQCRVDMLRAADGCCSAAVNDKVGREHCASCRDKDGCCRSYEDCVQCCLTADHMTVLQYQLGALRQKGAQVQSDSFDAFAVCQAACRTSSMQMNKHNKFIDPSHHYCYLIPAIASAFHLAVEPPPPGPPVTEYLTDENGESVTAAPDESAEPAVAPSP